MSAPPLTYDQQRHLVQIGKNFGALRRARAARVQQLGTSSTRERHRARLVQQKRLDSGPFMVSEFVAHDSRLRFGSLNLVPGDAINPQRPIAADANMP
jgi:hypothetical protein